MEPEGKIANPLPPDLIDADNKVVVTPKSPMEFEREIEEEERRLRKERGL